MKNLSNMVGLTLLCLIQVAIVGLQMFAGKYSAAVQEALPIRFRCVPDKQMLPQSPLHAKRSAACNSRRVTLGVRYVMRPSPARIAPEGGASKSRRRRVGPHTLGRRRPESSAKKAEPVRFGEGVRFGGADTSASVVPIQRTLIDAPLVASCSEFFNAMLAAFQVRAGQMMCSKHPLVHSKRSAAPNCRASTLSFECVPWTRGSLARTIPKGERRTRRAESHGSL